MVETPGQRDRALVEAGARWVDEERGEAVAGQGHARHAAVLAPAGERVVVPVHPVAKVEDTTGAGDLYAAGFLYGVAHELGLANAGRLGSLAAAEVISHVGARPAVSLQKLARDNGLKV